jgi:hypothetical protein
MPEMVRWYLNRRRNSGDASLVTIAREEESLKRPMVCFGTAEQRLPRFRGETRSEDRAVSR